MNLSRRSFLSKTGAGLTGAVIAGGSSLQAQEEASSSRDKAGKPPNILFIMSDDHAVNAIGCYGKRLAGLNGTPNIDRLAQEGMRLDRCYCTNAICVPSRASILTGTYSHENGVYSLRDALDPELPNVAQMLQQAGYQTAVMGKWHLKTEPSGFDDWKVLPGQGAYHNPVFKEKGGGQKRYEGYSADVIGDLTLDWLKQRDPEKPFMMMCHFKAPHEPWGYADRFSDFLADETIPEPDSLWEDKSHRSEGSRELGFTIDTMAQRQERPNYHHDGPVDFSGLSEEEKRAKAYQIFTKRYLRACKGVDDNIGRLLDYLDENGLRDNTVVIYTSDQGYFLGEHNYIDKRWMYEEAIQMPFVVRYPGEIEAGSETQAMVLNVDFPALFLDYAGLSAPAYMQGRSFRPVLQGKTPSDWRTSMYYRYWLHTNRPAHYGIRTERYKLIFFYGLPLDVSGASEETTPAGFELYDLEKDPHERQNVYGDPQYEAVAKRLKQELLQLKRELGDTDAEYPELLALQREYFADVMGQ